MPSSTKLRDNPTFQRAEMPISPIAEAPQRTTRAKKYEDKISTLLNTVMRATAGSEKTVADAAAIITHGPVFASKAGDLADEDERVRRAIDFVTSGTDNAYAAFLLAGIPLAVQILRNHETEAPVKVGIKIPFTKRTFKIPFRLRLRNPMLRSLTQHPKSLTEAVFSNPAIREALEKQQVEVAWSQE